VPVSEERGSFVHVAAGRQRADRHAAPTKVASAREVVCVAPKYEQLIGMSKGDLIAAYDEETPNVMVGLEWYRFELWRREASEQTKAVIWLTGVMTLLTAVNAALALAVLAKT
jgi:hypothetical protein